MKLPFYLHGLTIFLMTMEKDKREKRIGQCIVRRPSIVDRSTEYGSESEARKTFGQNRGNLEGNPDS